MYHSGSNSRCLSDDGSSDFRGLFLLRRPAAAHTAGLWKRCIPTRERGNESTSIEKLQKLIQGGTVAKLNQMVMILVP